VVACRGHELAIELEEFLDGRGGELHVFLRVGDGDLERLVLVESLAEGVDAVDLGEGVVVKDEPLEHGDGLADGAEPLRVVESIVMFVASAEGGEEGVSLQLVDEVVLLLLAGEEELTAGGVQLRELGVVDAADLREVLANHRDALEQRLVLRGRNDERESMLGADVGPRRREHAQADDLLAEAIAERHRDEQLELTLGRDARSLELRVGDDLLHGSGDVAFANELGVGLLQVSDAPLRGGGCVGSGGGGGVELGFEAGREAGEERFHAGAGVLGVHSAARFRPRARSRAGRRARQRAKQQGRMSCRKLAAAARQQIERGSRAPEEQVSVCAGVWLGLGDAGDSVAGAGIAGGGVGRLGLAARGVV